MDSIHRQISTLSQQIALIADEIDEHALSIRKLQAKKARAELELRNAKSSITLARKLPEELYRKIFHTCISEYLIASSGRMTPLTLSHVCASWRTATLASPILWSTIYVSSYSHPDLIKHHLVYSGAYPLTLVISTANDPSLCLVLSQVERWKDVYISTERVFEADQILAALQKSAIRIESLTVQVSGVGETTLELENLKTVFPRSPKFKRLSFSSLFLPLPSIFPEHIIHLELIEAGFLERVDAELDSFAARVLDILDYLPRLEFLSLKACCPFIRSTFDIVRGPQAPQTPMMATARRIVLSQLRILILAALPPLCAKVLTHLITPSLEELSIRNTSSNALRPTSGEESFRTAIQEFFSKVHREPDAEEILETRNGFPLRYLHVHNAPMPPQTLVHLSHLQALKLHDTDIEDSTLSELLQGSSGARCLEELDLRWEGRVNGTTVVELLRDLKTMYSTENENLDYINKRQVQSGVQRVTLLQCSHVREDDVLEVAKMTTCRLIADENDFCYPDGCCKNTRYRQRVKLRYWGASKLTGEWKKHLVL